MSNPGEPVTSYSRLQPGAYSDDDRDLLSVNSSSVDHLLGSSSIFQHPTAPIVKSSFNTNTTRIHRSNQCPFKFFVFWEIFFVLVGLACIGQAFFIPTIITQYFQKQVHKQIVITKQMQDDNSPAYQHWVSNNFSSSGKQIFQYFIFNITNPSEVLLGLPPKIKECGPYVYRRYEFRRAVEFSSDSSLVSYRYEYVYEHYPQMMSKGASYDDIVWVINPIILMFSNSYIRNPTTRAQKQFNTDIDYFLDDLGHNKHQKWVMNVSADTLLLNGNPNLFHWKFINTRNVSVTQYTGNENIDDIGSLIQYGEKEIKWWAWPEWVNVSRDSRVFPDNNWILDHNRLTVWAFDKYRKVDYIFQKKTSLHGLDLFKYQIDPRIYLNAKHNPHNAKYYQFGQDCLLNLSSKTPESEFFTKYHAPVFITQGLCYKTSLSIETIPQTNPNMNETFFEVEPKSGLVFHNHGSTMVSLKWIPMPKQPHGLYSKLYSGMVPFINTIADGGATQEDISHYLDELRQVETWEQASTYLGPAFGASIWIVALWACCRRRHVSKRADRLRKFGSSFGGVASPEKRIVDHEKKCPSSYESSTVSD